MSAIEKAAREVAKFFWSVDTPNFEEFYSREGEHYHEIARDAILAYLREVREPREDVSISGLEALYGKMREEFDYHKGTPPEVYSERDYPLIPASLLTARSSAESDAVWQAMIDNLIKEIEGE